jgi:hypothetical protein
VAALTGHDATVETLIDFGVHAYVRDCSGMNLLDVAIDLAEVQVAKSIIEHAFVQVYERDVRRAERVHVFWALRAIAVGRNERPSSPEFATLERTSEILAMVTRACWATIPRERHIKECFADGTTYAAVLLADEQRDIDEKEKAHAARSIQFAIKRRNKKKKSTKTKKTKK